MFFTREGCGSHCGHNEEGHQCRHEHGEGEHHCHNGEASGHGRGCCGHGGRRDGAGRKKIAKEYHLTAD